MTKPRSTETGPSDYAQRIFELQLQLARLGEPPFSLGPDVCRCAGVSAKFHGAPSGSEGEKS